jgi:hypothetical protein
MRSYFSHLLAALTRFLNALWGGDYRNSFSARVGAAAERGSPFAAVLGAVIDTLLFSRNHCREQAIEEGLIRP